MDIEDVELNTNLGTTKLVIDLYLYHYIQGLKERRLTEEEIMECVKKEIGKCSTNTNNN
jgi:hypothetical protein